MALENCIHQRVCKHFQEDEVAECAVKEICRHFKKTYVVDEADEFILKSERKDPQRDAELQDNFKQARQFLCAHAKDLDENQKAAIRAISGKHFSSLSREQVDQLIGIAADVKTNRGKK